MADERQLKVAAGMSTAAAIAAAMALLQGRRVHAEPGEPGEPGEVILPEEFVALVIAIANDSNAILNELRSLVLDPELTVKGWPDNTVHVRTTAVTCFVAGIVYRPDTLYVPDGMSLVIKSHPLNAVGSIAQVATSEVEAGSPETSYPLLPNEAISYRVKDAHEFFVSSTVAGSIVIFSTEQEV